MIELFTLHVYQYPPGENLKYYNQQVRVTPHEILGPVNNVDNDVKKNSEPARRDLYTPEMVERKTYVHVHFMDTFFWTIKTVFIKYTYFFSDHFLYVLAPCDSKT